ncbi:UDP-galactopyranose mutase [Acidisoma cellulosilytica]|uniref:UDP-galactopyranose mutase n=1 Tax=Acidisoma cellulosilyticum TaxID=2802395 RepID=A0A963Z2P0_9PROT|nr:UDP-galactopyranose mutase [Acidisoma cellulosilyticum]MCB8881743.1 UDP-galactopyranose mutase [Acidisoma cellulosilyticum]
MLDLIRDADIVIIGSGFSGAVIAERCSTELGLKSVILDRRAHAGGNSYSEIDPDTGIEVHKYGAHLFHTSNSEVWSYINRFTEFTDYKHRVLSAYQDKIYAMPINLLTISQFFGKFMTPESAMALIAEQRGEMAGKTPRNLEEKAISLIGRPLYEAFIRGYTMKQWQTDPRDLPENIITRLPVRTDFNTRYFEDRFEGLPVNGYAAIFERMLASDKIEVVLDTDFFDLRSQIEAMGKLVFYTGPLDRFYDYRFGALGWRTVDFERDVIGTKDFQGAPVINYADEDIPYTRILEFRHMHPERNYQTEKTVIFREYSRAAESKDEPYYPIGRSVDKDRYDQYRALAAAEENVVFGGRLGTYRYLDMHQAIGAALSIFDRTIKPRLTQPEQVSGRKVAAYSD